GRPAGPVVDVPLPQLAAARRELSTGAEERLDMVVLGSPHFSLEEFRRLAPLLAGQRCHPDVRFLVTTSRGVAMLAERAGLLRPLQAFGGSLTVDTCILTSPMLPPEVKTIMTNSAKYAYYAPGMLKVGVAFGTLEECVASAAAGRVIRDESRWNG
ncbi:MAG: aconitase X catalytic domain-containing protein, partial [Anaerolineae bacterium]|nr:aconitase X catalytic domain-containing protein [Anaerolineae bacterium]